MQAQLFVFHIAELSMMPRASCQVTSIFYRMQKARDEKIAPVCTAAAAATFPAFPGPSSRSSSTA